MWACGTVVLVLSAPLTWVVSGTRGRHSFAMSQTLARLADDKLSGLGTVLGAWPVVVITTLALGVCGAVGLIARSHLLTRVSVLLSIIPVLIFGAVALVVRYAAGLTATLAVGVGPSVALFGCALCLAGIMWGGAQRQVAGRKHPSGRTSGD